MVKGKGFKLNKYQHQRIAPKTARTGSDGFVYDSKTEMDRYYYLKILERAGEISDLKRQCSAKLVAPGNHWPIMVGKNRSKIAVYTPDFIYFDKDGNKVIEDVKGYDTESSKLRIRIYECFYRCHVTLVQKKGGRWVITK